MQNHYKLIRGATLGAIASIVTVTVITVAGELYAPLKDWLKSVFAHHWLGKSAISVIVFILFSLLGIVTLSDDEEKTHRITALLFGSAVFCTLVLTIFFIYHSWA